MRFEDSIIEYMKKKSKFEKVEGNSLLIREFKKEVASSFFKIKNIEEFVSLLNFVNQILYKSLKIIPLKFITYHAFYNKKAYKSFEISKKSGATRTINAPIKSLKNIQTTIAFIFSCIYKFPMVVHGFTNNKSVVTNAQHHVNKNYVYNIDLEDFFGSIHKSRIEKRLQVAPYNLSCKKVEIATLISRLVTQKAEKEEILNGKAIQKKYAFLPQGAPTSPILSNIICEKLDRRLLGLSKRFKVKYTRYADDITFSSMHNIYQKDSDFLIELNRIIEEQSFKINSKKTRLQKKGYRQEVTGLIVNEKVNVNRRYIKQLRAMIYSIEKFGLEEAENIFESYYLKDKGHIKDKAPSMENVLLGKLEYLKMVKGIDGVYLKLKTRYNKIYFPKREKIHKNNSKYNPKELPKILSKFSSNKKLMYSNHPWDSTMNYDTFIEELEEGFKKIDDDLLKLSSTLYHKMNNFLFLADEENQIGWSSKLVRDEIIKGVLPHKIPFNTTSQSFKTFGEAIDNFKSLFVVKDEDKLSLLDRFDNVINENDFQLDINLDYLGENSIDKFFTDTKRLETVFELILLDINENSTEDKKDILVEADSITLKNIDMIEIKIIHKGSTFSLAVDKLKETISKNGGAFKTIYKELFSLCDWSVETECKDGKYKIDYLYFDMIDSKSSCTPIEDEIRGFTHILRFYR